MTVWLAGVADSDEPQHIHTWNGVPMSWPRVLLIEAGMTYRYAADGTFAGDTWRASDEEAKHAATLEYGGRLTRWQQLPHDLDAIEIPAALELAASLLARRP
jgi:hypothetical protein